MGDVYIDILETFSIARMKNISMVRSTCQWSMQTSTTIDRQDYDIGFVPSLTHGGWLYVHIGAWIRRLLLWQFLNMRELCLAVCFPYGYGSHVSYSRSVFSILPWLVE